MVGDSPECQVCGTAIVDTPRLCPRCETPHHADCWEYTGRCSVYACMEVVPAGLAVQAGETLPAPLALSAERVAAIVPVPAAEERGLCWLADGQGAWLGRRSSEVSVAPGETVVMLPPEMCLGLMTPEQRARRSRSAIGAFAGGLATLLLAKAAGVLAFLSPVHAIGLAVGLGILIRTALGTPPDHAWLACGEKGRWIHAAWSGHPWEAPLAPERWPRRVRLARSLEDGWDDPSRTLLTYRLLLDWDDEPASRDPQERAYAIAAPLQMPPTAAARQPLLQQLVARRALGQHIAAALSIPFEEGVSR